MSAHLGILLAAVIVSEPLDPAARTFLNMRVTGGALQAFQEVGGSLGLTGKDVTPVEAIAPGLVSEVRERLATHDGWGRPLYLRGNGTGSFLLISYGEDGLPDVSYASTIRGEVDDGSPGRDYVWAGGMFVVRPEQPGDRIKRAQNDLAAISKAIEGTSLDPTAGLVPVSELAAELEPASTKELPRTDPWGQEYQVWIGRLSYLAISGGADLRLDRIYTDAATPASAVQALGAPASEGADIVVGRGYPARSVGERR